MRIRTLAAASGAAVALTTALVGPASAAKATNSVDCSDLANNVTATWVGGTEHVIVDYRTFSGGPDHSVLRNVKGKGSVTVATPDAVYVRISFVRHNGDWDIHACGVR